ncbi:MAG TPA: phosphopantetheine-binding protein, partial [Gammaproteobacteria bacterium]|nr:phosphopantetheine-binding protein [Gammaproteobacteria bacterium]
FDVQRPLEPSDGPAQIVRWDSLGSLRLLLALEDEFGLHLPEDALYGVSSVAAVVGVVDSALDAS